LSGGDGESIREAISKVSIANICAAAIIFASIAFAWKTNDAKLFTFLAGAAIGYFFPKK